MSTASTAAPNVHSRLTKIQYGITSFLITQPLVLGLLIRLVLALLLPVLLDDGVLLKGVKYTDIDYYVFTDAATHVFQGRSPYRRHTYRYTPFLASLLAWPMTDEGRGWWDLWRDERYFGRLLFCVADSLCGQIIIYLRRARRQQKLAAQKRKAPEEGCGTMIDPRLVDACWWLYNPLPINICTRGSAESLVVLLPVLLAVIFATSYSAIERQSGTDKARLWVALRASVAGVVFGISVHAKLYPIIYTVSFMASFSRQEQQLIVKDVKDERYKKAEEKEIVGWTMMLAPEDAPASIISSDQKPTGEWVDMNKARGYERFPWTRPWRLLRLISLWSHRLFLTPSPMLFFFFSALTFWSLTALAVQQFGHEALEEGLLYHFSRVDHRHNYSSFWYWIYLARGRLAATTTSGTDEAVGDMASNPMSIIGRLLFIPQAVLVLYTSLGLAPYDLTFALFVQTFLFVAQNKVITAQYFTWYLCLLPLCSDRIRWRSYRLVRSLLLLGLSIICWLGTAYCLEMRGMSVHRLVWLASIGFYGANIKLLGAIVYEYVGYEQQ